MYDDIIFWNIGKEFKSIILCNDEELYKNI